MPEANTVTYYSSNMLSGSNDRFRSAFGGYWELITNSNGSQNYTFVPLQTSEASSPFGDSSAVEYYGNIREYPTQNNTFVESIVFGTTYETTASNQLFVPNIKLPIRLIGNDPNIQSDNHWEAIVKGGSYGTSSYPPLVREAAYNSCHFQIERPYDILYVKTVDYDNYAQYKTYEMTYDYNYHLSEYQERYGRPESVREIPNFYDLLAAYLGHGAEMHSAVTDYLTLGGTYELKDRIFSSIITPYLPLYDIQNADIQSSTDSALSDLSYYDMRDNFVKYITGSLEAYSLAEKTFVLFNTKTSPLLNKDVISLNFLC